MDRNITMPLYMAFLRIWRFVVIPIMIVLAFGTTAQAVSLEKYPALVKLADRLSSEHGFDRGQLLNWFKEARIKPKIIDAMNRPAEKLSWNRYRGLFVNEASVRNGIRFMNAHRSVLSRAQAEFGIPKEIICAIIGIETRYGTVTGSLRVLDSLTTLSMEYPRRSKFFLSELEHFMVLADEHGLDPLAVKGSYAGAMGIPQFMPSSYRRYAIDYDDDGRSDLLGSVDDAVGSVANYLKVHHWRVGDPVTNTVPRHQATGLEQFVTRRLKVNTALSTLVAAGVTPSPGVDLNWDVGVMKFDDDGRPSYRIGYHNFFVITRYNRSQNYAMSVFELAEEIKAGSGN
ncbi:MAG TPA: lytic murein transglycosylase B [Gammaproteobacteria bacterium]|nr:lytic murein transglycosylase B [Gammaproteobacteria bacterium]